MLLSRLVRIQLIVFAIASLIGLSLMVVRYLQLPTLMGIGHIKVTLELPAAGGLYRFSNVTYRGVQVGKVTDITVVDGKRVNATLSLDSSTIPADASAHVRSMSAAGEQYVDLQPLNESGPYLRDGSVITLPHTTIPQRAGPMLDQLSALVDSIPKDRLGNLLDETFKGFDGAGYDFGSLLDSSATLSGDFNRNADRARTLVDDSVPLLQSQTDSVGAIKVWAHGLAGVTGQLARNDPQLRTILQTGPGLRAASLGAARPDQADTAGAAGQPHHHRPDRSHLSRIPGADPGPAAAQHRHLSVGGTDRQSHWRRDGRL